MHNLVFEIAQNSANSMMGCRICRIYTNLATFTWFSLENVAEKWGNFGFCRDSVRISVVHRIGRKIIGQKITRNFPGPVMDVLYDEGSIETSEFTMVDLKST